MFTSKQLFYILVPDLPCDTFGSVEDVRALGKEVCRLTQGLVERYSRLPGKRRTVKVSVACFVIAYKYVMGYDFDGVTFVERLCRLTNTRAATVRRLEGRILKGLEWRVQELVH